MPRLKSANFAVTELTAGIDASVTSLKVADASLFPSEGPFMILVHDSTPGFAGVREIMEVGSINKGTNTFSDVLRGREGTSPVAHSAGARAECIWTAGTHGELADKVDLDAHLSDYTQLEKRVETLEGIAISSWADVQQIVRAGLAPSVFGIGDQLVSSYDGGEIIWEVIGIDHDVPVDTNYTHSLTIQTKDCLHNIQFDAPEPTNPDTNRKSYGNNRYIHSAVRQWLNSNEDVFQWVSQHEYDATPTDSLALYGGAGFLKRLDSALVAVLGKVNKKVAQCDYDSGGQDTFSDKVFLLSRVEVGLGTEGVTDGEVVYPYYDGISDAGRIKLLDGLTRYWWLRSPNVGYSYSVRLVYTSGAINTNRAYYASGLAPACVII